MFETVNDEGVIQPLIFNVDGSKIKNKEEAQRMKEIYYPGFNEVRRAVKHLTIVKAA
jgi:hypothetical protein